MNIIIGADLVPTKTNNDLFKVGDAEKLIGLELKNILDEADYRIFNLEVPLTDEVSPIEKNGPNLIASKDTINGYKAIGVDILTLANNHILDQGSQGLDNTKNILKKSGIACVGAGKTLAEASKPYIFECDSKKIGIYACAEHEFSIVTPSSSGANPFDPLESLDHVSELKKQCDYVIILYHGAKEHYRYPSPNLQKICRKLVQKGADLVICQHSHCIGCEEKYNDGTIVYGQGNFLFDYSDSEYWQTSLLIKITDGFKISYIPLIKDTNKVKLAKDEKAKEILTSFEDRSYEIKQSGFVEKKYNEFADSLLLNYLSKIGGKESFIFKVINKILGNRLRKWCIKRRYPKEKLLAIRNYIECEAHSELIIRAIGGKRL